MTDNTAHDEVRILSPTAILGYGFPESSFEAGLQREPHLIAVDAGSTDPGPYYLGAGVSFTDREAVKRDLRLMLVAGRRLDVPIVIGTGGGAGAHPHVTWTLDTIRQIAREEGLHFRLAVIHADVAKPVLLDALAAGDLGSLPPGPDATVDDIVESTHVVGQMGVEPFVRALDVGADVILAGRAYDPAVFAALPIRRGFDPGLALHLGKILECAAIAASPGSGSDCMLGVLRRDHFLIEPLNPDRACTVTSVAAHTLYEKTNPYRLPGPGGVLDLTGTTFDQHTDRVVRVAGSRFVPSDGQTIKLEAARKIGYRTVSVAGARDPIFIAKIDEIVAAVRNRVADNFAHIPADDYQLLFHLYGKNGVMGPLEPTGGSGHELGIVIEAVAGTQELANTVCAFARSTMLHHGYPGRISTAGNLAFPYSPSDFKGGEVYRFSLYHLLTVTDPAALFPIDVIDVAGDEHTADSDAADVAGTPEYAS
jgi:Acyclic terpene utilisation family protein AtuA